MAKVKAKAPGLDEKAELTVQMQGMVELGKSLYDNGEFTRNPVCDWMEEHVTLRGQIVEVMDFAKKYVKAARLSKGFDVVSLVVAILTSGFPTVRIDRPRGEGPESLEKLELASNLMLREMDLERGLPIYTQLFFDMALFGRGTVQMLPAKDYHDLYNREGLEATEKYGCAPFRLDRIDPRTWYPFPDEWEPQEGVKIEMRPAFWAAQKYGLQITEQTVQKKKLRTIEKLGKGRYHVAPGITHVEWVEMWLQEATHYFVDGVWVDSDDHGYGAVLEAAGIPQRVPFFTAPGITGSGSDALLQGMPLLYPVRDLLPFLSMLLNFLATAALVNIGRLVHYGPGKDVPDSAVVDLKKAQEELGFQVEATLNMEKYELVQGASNFSLIQVAQMVERMIDDSTVPPVLRGVMPPSGTSATLNREVYESAFARFTQMNENGNKLYWQIVRAMWSFIENDFGYDVSVYPGKGAKDEHLNQRGFVTIGPEDINGWRLLDVKSKTGLPNNDMVNARFAFENWQKNVGTHKKAVEAAGEDDYDGYLGDRLSEDVFHRGYPLAVDTMIRQAFPAAMQNRPQIYDKNGNVIPPADETVRPSRGPEVQDQTGMDGNQGSTGVPEQSRQRGAQEAEEAMYA